MTQYTSGQITAMNTALNQAQAATNPAGVMSALNDYYAAQTSIQGCSTLWIEAS